MTATQPPSVTQPPLSGLPPIGTQSGRRKWWQRWPFIVALVAAVIAGVLVIALRPNDNSNDAAKNDFALPQDTRDAMSAGEKNLVAVTSYDYKNLDKDFANALSASTESFKQELQKTWDETVRPHAVADQQSIKSKVRSIGAVEPVSANRAVLVAFVDETVSNIKQKKPNIAQSSIQVVLQKEKNDWLVSQLDLVDLRKPEKTAKWDDTEITNIVNAGRDCTAKLLTTRATQFDADFIAKQNCATGNLRKDLDDNAKRIRDTVLTTKAEAVATIHSVAISQASTGAPRVLAAVTTKTTVDKQESTLSYRVALNMKKVNNKWLAETEDLLPPEKN